MPDPRQAELPLGPQTRVVATSSPGTISERFAEFHTANPWVYEALVALARDEVAAGQTRVGVSYLVEVLRWHYRKRTVSTDGLKINNDYRARYARMIAAREPDLAGVFELRSLRSVA